MYTVAVLTISDKCSKGEREDGTGRVVQGLVKKFPLELVKYEIVPDELKIIKKKLVEYSDKLKINLVLTNGGTGFGPRDVTPEATKEVLNKEVLGIPEAMRISCINKEKRAMLSRAASGIRGKTLIVNLPGSPKAAKESLEPVIEALIHGLDMIAGKGH